MAFWGYPRDDCSQFVASLLEWYNTDKPNQREAIDVALARMKGPALDWALSHDEISDGPFESLIKELAAIWPPMFVLRCEDLKNMRQKEGQDLQDYISDVAYRVVQHMIIECECYEHYSVLEGTYDPITAYVHDIVNNGVYDELKPFLFEAQTGLEKFSSNMNLVRMAVARAERTKIEKDDSLTGWTDSTPYSSNIKSSSPTFTQSIQIQDFDVEGDHLAHKVNDQYVQDWVVAMNTPWTRKKESCKITPTKVFITILLILIFLAAAIPLFYYGFKLQPPLFKPVRKLKTFNS